MKGIGVLLLVFTPIESIKSPSTLINNTIISTFCTFTTLRVFTSIKEKYNRFIVILLLLSSCEHISFSTPTAVVALLFPSAGKSEDAKKNECAQMAKQTNRRKKFSSRLLEEIFFPKNFSAELR